MRSPQTGQQLRSSVDGTEPEGKASHAFSFPSVEAVTKRSDKHSPTSKFPAKRSVLHSINQNAAAMHKTVDTGRNLAPLANQVRPGGPPGTAGTNQRPMYTAVGGAHATSQLSSAATNEQQKQFQFNNTRHQRRGHHQSIVQNTDRANKFEPLNF